MVTYAYNCYVCILNFYCNFPWYFILRNGAEKHENDRLIQLIALVAYLDFIPGLE